MKFVFPTAMLIASAAPAFAQDLLGFEYVGSSATLNYQTMAASGDELFADRYTLGFSGTAEFNIGSNFGLDISIGQHERNPGRTIRTQSRYIDLNPYLRFENAELGFFYTYVDDETYLPTRTLSVHGALTGINGSYALNDLTFEGYVGRFDNRNDEARSTVGLGVSYDVTDALSVYYSNERDIWRGNSGDFYYGLASLGVRYDLSEIAGGQPISFGAEYSGYYFKDGPGSRESISDLDQSQVTMTVTYSFGGTETSLFNGIRNRDRSLR